MVKYISLGACSVKKQMQNNNIMQETLPFDWLKTKTLDSVSELLLQNFYNLFEDLVFIKNDFDNKFFVDKHSNKISSVYSNEKYGVYFYHDFYNIDIDDQLNFVKNKYHRRINRLNNILLSNEKIIFVRDDMHININKINFDTTLDKFDIALKKINPEISYELIWIVNPTKKTSDQYINKNFSNTKIIISSEKPKKWWHDEINWESIFTIQ